MRIKKCMRRILSIVCIFVLTISALNLSSLVVHGSENEYTRLGFEEFGITQETSHAYSTSSKSHVKDINSTLHGMEIEGIVNVSGASTGNSYLSFGVNSYSGNGWRMTWTPNATYGNHVTVDYFEGYSSGSEGVSYLNLNGVDTGLELFDNDIILNVKFSLAKNTDTTSDVTIVLTLTDADDTSKTFTKTYTYKNRKNDYLKQSINVYNVGTTSTVTLKPYERKEGAEYTKLGFEEFGITQATSHAYSTSSTQYTYSDESLHGTEIEGVVNVSSRTSGSSYLSFGYVPYGSGWCLTWVPNATYGDHVTVGFKSNYNDSGTITYLNINGVDTGMELFDNDIILNVKFSLAKKTNTTSDVTVILTLTDADDTSKTFTKEYTYSNKSNDYLKRKMNVYNPAQATVTLKPYVVDTTKNTTNLVSATWDGTQNHSWGTLENGENWHSASVVATAPDYYATRVYSNLPDYLIGHEILQPCNTNAVTVTAKEDCYVYILTWSGGVQHFTDLGFRSIASYEKNAIYYNEAVTLMEKKLTAESSITYSGYYVNMFATSERLVTNLQVEYTTLDLSDFSVFDEISVGEWTTSEQGNTHTAGEGTLHAIEVIGKYKFDSTTFDNGYGTTNYAKVYFGGETQNFYVEYRPVQQYLQFGYNDGNGNQGLSETYRITKEDAEAVGLSLFDTELLMSVKFACYEPDEANSDIAIIVTISDLNDSEKAVTRELSLVDFPMGGMQRIIRVAQNFSGRMTYAPVVPVVTGPITYETLGFDAFGIGYGNQTGGWFAEQGTSYQGGEGSLHATEIIGNYVLDPFEYDNGYGTTNYARVYFGDETDNFFMNFSPKYKYIQFGFKKGGTAEKLADEFNITQADMEAAGLSFFDSLTTMSVKFACKKPTGVTSDVQVVVTLSNPKDATKSVTRELTLKEFPVSGLKRILTISQAYDCRFKYEPLEVVVEDYTGKIEKLDIGHFGAEDKGAVGGFVMKEQQHVFKDAKGILHATEVTGNFLFGSEQFDNNYGTTNYTRIYYGGEGKGFFIEFRPVQEYLRFGYTDASGATVFLNQSNNITKADMEAIGLSLIEEYMTIRAQFICATPDEETSNIKVIVTVSDVKDDSKKITKEMTIADFPMSNMNRVLTMAQCYNGNMEYAPKQYVVTGNKVNFRRFGFTEKWAKELGLK